MKHRLPCLQISPKTAGQPAQVSFIRAGIRHRFKSLKGQWAMGEQTIVPEVLLDKAIELGLSFSDSAFPIGIFPSEIRNIIAEVHECQGFPIDYIASAMLVAIAVGIGNTHLVQLKRGWQESAMLYVALVGRPGTNKSHPLSFAM